ILDIGTIAFDQGQVTIDDAVSELMLEAHIEPLGEPMAFDELVGTAQTTGSTEHAFAWRASGRYQGQRVEGEGKADGVLALQDADQPFPLQADVLPGSTRILLSGTLFDSCNLRAVDLQLKLSGISLINLYPLTRVTLPDTPPYTTDGHVS